LHDNERVDLVAVILVECFTPSNIANLYAGIDSWQVQPPEVKDRWKQEIREWRQSRCGGAWSSIGFFARTGFSQPAVELSDDKMPSGVEAVNVLIASAVPSLTLLIAVFYMRPEQRDQFTDRLRRDFGSRVNWARFEVRGKFGWLRQWNPLSRARNVYSSAYVADPSELQCEWCGQQLERVEAHCWHWLGEMALGRFGSMPRGKRPSIRAYVTDQIEPFGNRRGPLSALNLDYSHQVWGSRAKDGFYFADVNDFMASHPRHSVLAADKETLAKALGWRDPISTTGLIDKLIRHVPDIFRAWVMHQLLNKYRDDIAAVRDTSLRTRSGKEVADDLNDFLNTDGHDAVIVSDEIARLARDDFFLSRLPLLIDFSDPGEDSSDDVKTWPGIARTELLESAQIVGREQGMTTTSIGTTAQLLQSITNIKLQQWTLIMAVVIAVVAIISA
jgi:hypothetical protein